MPAAPKSLFFARIVYRLLTTPRGWRVDDMMEQFEIQPRTYRNYRKTLQDQLVEFHREDGTSMIQEVRNGETIYLRIVDLDEASPVDDDYLSRIAAFYFAERLLGFVRGTEIGDAVQDLLVDFHHRLKDRPFALQNTLKNVDRMFFEVPTAPKDYSDKGEVIRDILRGLVYNFVLDVTYDSTRFGALKLRLCPYTLATHGSALYLIARAEKYEDARYYAVDRILDIDVTKEKFDYPSRDAYDPRTWCDGGFGLFRSDSDEQHDFELVFADKRWLKTFLRERRWSPTQDFEELEDGRLRMTFTASSDVQVWPWIRSFGTDVEVLTPCPVD